MNIPSKLVLSALCLGALPFAQATEFEDYGRVVRVPVSYTHLTLPTSDLV